MTIPDALKHVLTDSLSSGIFIDTKIYAFSRRSQSSGRVWAPKPLYANSHVLKQIPYFKILLSKEYAEGAKKDLRADFPNNESPYKDDYEYWSDSDLEDDDSEDNEIFDKENNFDLDPDCDEGANAQCAGVGDNIYIPSTGTNSCNVIAPIHLGKVAIIKDAAYATLQALLFYLYTGEIDFAPFTMESTCHRNLEKASKSDYTKLPRPSAKSVYRIADEYNIPKLQQLAFDYICNNLSQCDIFRETFSHFTSRYEEIREKEILYLWNFFFSDNPEVGMDHLTEKIRQYGEGQLPHCADIFSALFLLLVDKNQTIPKDLCEYERIREPHYYGSECSHWARKSKSWHILKKALAKSMTTGTFLDFKFYASSSSGTKPFYCSQSVVETRLNELRISANIDPTTVTLRNLANHQNEYETDSDLDDDEEDHEVPSNYIPENPRQTDDNSAHPVFFHMGAAVTWKSLLYFLYTEEVFFSLLRSQTPRDRTIIKEGIQPGSPVICSPKSLYVLADEIGLCALRDLALNDIASKITADNVVTELFSRSSSSNEKVLAMESKALITTVKLDTSQTIIEQVLENISTMSQGRAAHKTEALRSVFQQKYLLSSRLG